MRLAGVKEAGLDAAEGAEHPGMLAPYLPLQLIPLAGNHMKDILQTWRARDIQSDQKKVREGDRGRRRSRRAFRCELYSVLQCLNDKTILQLEDIDVCAATD